MTQGDVLGREVMQETTRHGCCWCRHCCEQRGVCLLCSAEESVVSTHLLRVVWLASISTLLLLLVAAVATTTTPAVIVVGRHIASQSQDIKYMEVGSVGVRESPGWSCSVERDER